MYTPVRPTDDGSTPRCSLLSAGHQPEAGAPERMTRVAVLHDGTVNPGGAVDVVTRAATVLDADLYVGYSGVERDWWLDRVPDDVRVLTGRETQSTVTDARVALAFLRLSLDEYDVVLSSGPGTKFYQPSDDQRVVHYLHHPPLAALWFDGSPLDYLVTVVDRIETWTIPTVIANSELTADRMETHYNRRPDAVVNPPVDVARFRTDRERRADEVVMVGRLEERKRPLLAVEAFRRLHDRRDDGQDPPRLRLLGDGPLREQVEGEAPPNVTVEGYVDDAELAEAVERASAGLFLARREDFGVTPIEYMAAGTPVVGVDEPNTNDQVTAEETGILVAPEPDAVADGVRRALGRDWDRDRIREDATAYGLAAFDKGLRRAIERD